MKYSTARDFEEEKTVDRTRYEELQDRALLNGESPNQPWGTLERKFGDWENADYGDKR